MWSRLSCFWYLSAEVDSYLPIFQVVNEVFAVSIFIFFVSFFRRCWPYRAEVVCLEEWLHLFSVFCSFCFEMRDDIPYPFISSCHPKFVTKISFSEWQKSFYICRLCRKYTISIRHIFISTWSEERTNQPLSLPSSRVVDAHWITSWKMPLKRHRQGRRIHFNEDEFNRLYFIRIYRW